MTPSRVTLGGMRVCTSCSIIFFAYFYSTIQYNPIEMANNLRKNNGAIPGIRPGKPTSDYIMRVLSRLTLIGSLMLLHSCLVPHRVLLDL